MGKTNILYPWWKKSVRTNVNQVLYKCTTFVLIATGIPVAKKVPLFIPSLQIEKVPQKYPVPVIVKKPVPYQVDAFDQNLTRFLNWFFNIQLVEIILFLGGETSIYEGGEKGTHAHRENHSSENWEACTVPCSETYSCPSVQTYSN